MRRVRRVLRRKIISINKRWVLFDTKTLTYKNITFKKIVECFVCILTSLFIVCFIFNKRGYNLGVEISNKNYKDSIEFYKTALSQTKGSLNEINIKYEMIKPKYLFRYTGKDNSKYNYEIKRASEIYGVPEAIIKAVIETESGYNDTAVSPIGARGLMQIMPSNFKSLRVNDPNNPAENIMAGTELLKRCYLRYGNWDDAFRHYNGGFRGVYAPKNETEEYVKKVKNRYEKTLNE